MAVVPAGDASRVRLHRARSRADGPLSAPRRVRDRGPARLCGTRAGAGATGTLALRGPAVRHAERRRKTARHHRRRAGADRATAHVRTLPVRVLLLDEPTAALDLAYQLEIAVAAARSAATDAALDRDLDARSELRRQPLPIARAAARTDRVLAAGPTDDVLTPALIRTLYGVEADVHAPRREPGISSSCRSRRARTRTARVTRIGRRRLRRRPSVGFGALAAGGASSSRRSSGSTPVSLRRAFDPVDPVRGQRRRADLLRRAPAAHARRRAGRRARSRRRASSSRACCAIRWRRRSRSASRPARRSARCSRSRSAGSLGVAGLPAVPGRQLRRLARRRRDRLCAGARAASRAVDQRAAARRRHDERVLLGADPVRAVLRGLRGDLSHRCAG